MKPISSSRARARARALLLLGALASAGAAFLLLAACSSDDPVTPGIATPDAADESSDPGDNDAGGDKDTGPVEPPQSLEGCTDDPGPSSAGVDAGADAGDGGDPFGGAANFTLANALEGYPSSAQGVLTALITTEKGAIKCTLDEAAAPITVANFVGLARGTRPYLDKSTGTWKTKRLYDGLIWHRVIPDFVIQGGDPLGNGTGGPGYDGVDENHIDEPLGTLAEAARIKPSGSQFYVVVGKGPAANYNVFGKCTTGVAINIAAQPRDKADKPKADIHMTRIDIARCP